MTQTTNLYIDAAYLPIMLLKPFGLLQRVIKSQKMSISIGHIKIQYPFSQKSL